MPIFHHQIKYAINTFIIPQTYIVQTDSSIAINHVCHMAINDYIGPYINLWPFDKAMGIGKLGECWLFKKTLNRMVDLTKQI